MRQITASRNHFRNNNTDRETERDYTKITLDRQRRCSIYGLMPKIGPHSRPDRLQIIDGRRAESKLLASVKKDLTAHLGGKPSAVQRMLIDRIAALSLRCHLMERESAQSGEMSERNGRSYLAWSNSLTRALRQIGLDAVPPPKSKPLTPRQIMKLDQIDA